MKIASKHFESICKEFARKLYKSMTVDEMNWMFDASGHLSNGLLLDGRMEQLFYELAAPKLRKAASETCFKTLRKQYDVQQSRDHLNTAIDIIEHYLEMNHILWLKQLVECRDVLEPLTDDEKAFLDAYDGKSTPEPQKPVKAPSSPSDEVRELVKWKIYEHMLNSRAFLWNGTFIVHDIKPLQTDVNGNGVYLIDPGFEIAYKTASVRFPVHTAHVTGDSIYFKPHPEYQEPNAVWDRLDMSVFQET